MSEYNSFLDELEEIRRKKRLEEEEQRRLENEQEAESGAPDFLKWWLPRGVAGAVAGVANLFGADIHDNFGLGKSTGAVSGFLEGTTQFLAGFLPGTWGVGHLSKATGVMKGTGYLATLGRGATAGAVADFFVFDGNDARLSNLIQDFPDLQNPLTAYLAADEEDDELLGRMKNTLEGGLVGGTLESVMYMFRAMRRFNKASREGDQAGMDDAVEDISNSADDALNSPENPDLEDMVDSGRNGGGPTDAAREAEADMDHVAPRQEPEAEPELTDNPRDIANPNDVDPAGGDVWVVDTEDPAGLMRGYSSLENVAQVPGTRLGLFQLKPLKDLKVAKGNTAAKLGIRKQRGMSDAAWLEQQKKALQAEGYDVLMVRDHGKTVAHVLNEDAIMKRIEISPTSKYMQRKARQVAEGQRDPQGARVMASPLERTRDQARVASQEELEAAAEALLRRQRQTEGEARAADLGVEGAEDAADDTIAGLLNIRTQTSADNAHTAAALIDTLRLRELAGEQGVVTHNDLVQSVAKSELPRQLGLDPNTVANELWNFHGQNVRMAYREAMAARLVMDHLSGQIKKLAQDVVEKSKDLSVRQVGTMTSDAALPLDEVSNLLLKQIDAYQSLAIAYGKVRGEMGRGLNSFGISTDRFLSNEIAKNVLDRGGRTGMVKMARAIADLDNLQIAQMASRNTLQPLMDRLTPYYMFSLLSKPATLTTNIIGTSMMGIFAPLERAAGAWLQSIFRKNPEAKAGMTRYILQNTQNARTRAELLSDLALFRDTKTANSIREAASRSGESGRSVLTGRASAMRESDSQLLGQVPQDGEGLFRHAMAKLIGLPGRIMAGSDEGMKQVFYQSEIQSHLRRVGETELGLSGSTLETWVHHKTHRFLIEGEALTEKSLRADVERQIDPDAYIDPQIRRDEVNARVARRMADADQIRPGPRIENIPVPLAPGETMATIGERAMKLAETQTFTRSLEEGDGFLAKAGSQLMGLAEAYPVVRLVAPFIRTPMNILIETGKRLPIPVVNKNMTQALALMTNKLTKSAGFEIPTLKKMGAELEAKLRSSDEAVAAETAGQLMVAGSLAMTAYALAGSGVITGRGPQDPEAQKALRQTGWQPYSLRNGDTYISFQRLDPFGGMLGFVGDMGDLTRYGSPDQDLSDLAFASVLSVMRNISDKSYISGLVDVAGAVKDPDRYMQKVGQRLSGALLVPNVVAGIEQIADPTLKEAYGLLDAAQRRVPGLSSTMDKQRNFLGEPLSRKMMSKGYATAAAWWDFIMPLSINTVSSNVIEQEINNLMYPMNEPDPTRFGVDLRDYYTDDKQSAYDRWQELTSQISIGGRKLRPAIERLIKSQKYQKLPAESYRESGFTSPRVLEIRKIVNRYRRRAQKMLLKEFPQLREDTGRRRLIMERQRHGATADEIMNLMGG
jgi:hypothetical protein